MTASQVEKWVNEKMNPDQWYDVPEGERWHYKLLISDCFGWPVFQLSFNNEMTKIKKIII